jgi:hypothetical protein
MNEPPNSFEEIRREVDQQQRATVWPDTVRNGRSIDAFLWKGDPKAKPMQRIGLVVFALTFLLLALGLGSIPFQKDFEDGWPVVFLMAFLAFLLSLRLLRNAFLRSPRTKVESVKQV